MKKEKGGKKMECREVTSKEYVELCFECKKEIRGSSPESALHNLRIHKMTQHSSRQNNDK